MSRRLRTPLLAAAMIPAIVAAVSASPPRDLLARIDSLHVNHHVAEAESLVVPLLAQARAAGDSALVLPLASKLGRLRASYGRPQEGEPLLQEAVDLAAALGDTLARCDALRWLALASDQQGNHAAARTALHELRALAVASGDSYHQAWSLVGLAYAAGRDGDYAQAEADYRRASELFHDLGASQPEAWALNGLGAVISKAGRLDEAEAVFRRAENLAASVNYTAVEALVANNLGDLEFAVGDPGLALVHFRRARELQTALAQRQDAVISGANMVDCLVELGRLDEAEAQLDELLRVCRDGGFRDREPPVLARVAHLLRLRGRPREAAAVSRGVLALEADLVDMEDRVQHVIGLSRAVLATDGAAAARTVLEDGRRRMPLLAGGGAALDLDLESARVAVLAAEDERAAALLAPVVAAARAGGFDRRLLAALLLRAGLERGGGVPGDDLASLREAAEVWERVRSVPQDPLWREMRGATGAGLPAELARSVYAAALDAGAEDPARAAFDAVQVFKARTMAERIGRTAAPTSPTTAAELVDRTLAADETLLDYHLGRERSVVFAVDAGGVRLAELPAASDLEAMIRLYRDLASSSGTAPEATDAAGARLADVLLGGVLDLRGAPTARARQIVVVPDGALNLIPFASLVPAVEVWSRAPSASIIVELRGGRGGRGTGVLAFATPHTREGSPLPGAVREARRLASRYRGVELRIAGEDRTPPLRPDDLAAYAVLHLAGHARADDRRPWSGELLLDPHADVDGAAVRADRIAELSLAADLVVLSACETAAGPVASGEGVLGLSSAFLAAGAPAVIATLWPVDDAVAARMTEALYAELAAGAPAARALATARDRLRRDPGTAAAFHWAPFVLIGDGQAHVRLNRRPDRRLLGLGLVAALALAGGIVVRRRG